MSSIQKVQHSQSFIMFSGAFLLTLGDVSWRRVQWSLCELISPSWRFFSTSRLWMPLSCVYVPSSSGSKVQEAHLLFLGMSDQNKGTLSAHLLSLLQDCLYSFTDSKQHKVRTAQLSLQGQSVDRAHKA